MTDSLNQIGKYIKKSNREGELSLKRPFSTDPTVERIRDIFDPVVPFRMDFYTKEHDKRVLLYLYFQPPPPTGCCGPCECQVCEKFTDGEEDIVLTYSYIPNTVRVYFNNVTISDFTETNPSTGEVTITTAISAGEELTICYVHEIC